MEDVFHQNKVIVQERKRGTQETGAGIYQEEGEGKFQAGLGRLLYRLEGEALEPQEGYCQGRTNNTWPAPNFTKGPETRSLVAFG